MITIKKAKVNKVGYMEIEYTETIKVDKETLSRDHVAICEYTPHEDLLASFAKLKPFLIDLCDQKISGDLKIMLFDDDTKIDAEVREAAVSEYVVSGFTIGGSDEHEGVTLIGSKKLANNRRLNLVSPFTKWEDENNPYGHAHELEAVIEECQSEVEAYLVDFKRAPQLQTTLEFGESENPLG